LYRRSEWIVENVFIGAALHFISYIVFNYIA
jgi:hypothetical protein